MCISNSAAPLQAQQEVQVSLQKEMFARLAGNNESNQEQVCSNAFFDGQHMSIPKIPQ
jgi:hypothetical protein